MLKIPLFPLNVVLFPGMTLPLRIFEPRYLKMIEVCLGGDPVFGVTLIKEGSEVGAPAVPHVVGTTARIIGVERKSPGLLHITTVGEERFRLRQVFDDQPYLVAEIEPFPLQNVRAPDVDILADAGVALLSVYLELLSQANGVEIQLGRVPDTPQEVAHLVGMILQAPGAIKQELLAFSDLSDLLRREAALLQGEISALTVMLRGREVAESDTPSHLSRN
jgi:Lon protease-like protein